MSQEFDSKVLDLVKQKGFYPYEYMNNFGKFREKFPSKEKLYSLLTGKNISDKEYVHVRKVWEKFKMKMKVEMKNYQDFYLKYDGLLLGDVSKNLEIVAPALSLDAMLNVTKVELELISDFNMYLFFEKVMRGGNSYICKRYSKPNSKYLKSYVPK